MKKKNDRTPLWLEGKTVNEVLFCQEFLAEHPNALHPLAQKAFSSFLKNNERTYNLEYSNKVTNREGKQVRGFMGIELIRPPLLM